MSKNTIMDIVGGDDFGWSSFFANPDRVAAVRIILGLKPEGHLPGKDESAFRGIMSDLIDAALEKYVECPERVQLLFEREKTNMKLIDAVASSLGLKTWSGNDDIGTTRIRNKLRLLKTEWAKAEEEGRPAGDDPTQLGILLNAEFTISKRLAELDNKTVCR